MGSKGKKGQSKGGSVTPTAEDMRKMGMSEEQIVDLIAQRDMSPEERATQQEEDAAKAAKKKAAVMRQKLFGGLMEEESDMRRVNLEKDDHERRVLAAREEKDKKKMPSWKEKEMTERKPITSHMRRDDDDHWQERAERTKQKRQEGHVTTLMQMQSVYLSSPVIPKDLAEHVCKFLPETTASSTSSTTSLGVLNRCDKGWTAAKLPVLFDDRDIATLGLCASWSLGGQAQKWVTRDEFGVAHQRSWDRFAWGASFNLQ